METNKFPNFQKCGEILIDIKSKNKKNKIYVFHCTFCNLECDQLKKFSLHIGEEHLNDFGDILKETELKFEAEPEEIKLPSFADVETSDIKVFESPIESKKNVNPDPLDTVAAASSATKSENLNCEVKYEIIEHSFDESAADMGVMDGTVSMSDSDKETYDKSDSDDDYIDVPSKKRKTNKTPKKGNQNKRKESANDTSSDEESKDAECNMNSKIKSMPFYGSNLDMENKSCGNCKQLSRQIYSLQESVSNLCRIVQQQNESIMSGFAEMKVVTTELVRQEVSNTAVANFFPVTSDQMLKNLEEQISADNSKIYVSTMNKLWRNCVGKNLENILDRKMVMAYNVDGTHGKLRLKEYQHFYKALIDSIACLPSLGENDPEMMLRQAMQLCKKKQFRQQSNFNKKLEEVAPEAN